MKNQLNTVSADIIRQLAAAALGLALALTLSCGKDKADKSDKAVEDVKRLEYITDDVGDLIEKFEYDDKNRLVKVYEYNVIRSYEHGVTVGFDYGEGKIASTKTITYNGDDSVTVDAEKFVKNGNTITSKSDTITINEDGYLVSYVSHGDSYQYQDGNMTEQKEEWPRSYSYSKFDDKKTPFSNTNTPKWLLLHLVDKTYANKNNVLKKEGRACWVDYTYEYNSEGLPTKRTSDALIDGGDGIYSCGDEIEIVHFVYSGRTAEEIAAFDAARLAVKKERLAAKEAAKNAIEAAENALAAYIKPEKDKASKEGRIFTDNRDSKTYMWVKIGTQIWMAENLNYDTFGGCESQCRMYGMWYSGDNCPSGWHLPSTEEWKTLVDFAGGEKAAAKKLKAKSGWDGKSNGTNDYGFLALPGGYEGVDSEGMTYPAEIGSAGRWLTSDSSTVYISEDISLGTDAEGSYSIRCVKDEEKTSETETTQ